MDDTPAAGELNLDELDAVNGAGILGDIVHAVQTVIHFLSGGGPVTKK